MSCLKCMFSLQKKTCQKETLAFMVKNAKQMLLLEIANVPLRKKK